MRAFVSVEEMLSIDRETMRACGISSFDLMEKVADEMAQVLLRDSRVRDSILVLAGPGNNGGDAWRLAENLRCAGRKVFVWELVEAVSADCKKAKSLFAGEKVKKLVPAETVIDGVFGLSGRSELSVEIARTLRTLNQSRAFRISLDVPTGVDSEKGQVHSDSFEADLSLVVGYPKLAFLNEDVAATLGELKFVRGKFVDARRERIFCLEDSDFKFQKVARAGHKGLRGRVGVIGGSAKMPGAAFLASEAAYRAGAGYVTNYFAEPGALKLKIKDASFLLRLKWKAGDLLKESSLVVGPGGVNLKKFKWSSVRVPMVIDAEALSDWTKARRPHLKSPAVLTPHIGEAARLLGWSNMEVKKNRLIALTRLVEKTNQSIYLKGAPGLLKFAPEEGDGGILGDGDQNGDGGGDFQFESSNIYVNLSANPVFSKAGSGDVLSGILGGFLAQRPHDFFASVTSGLVFQRVLGDVLRGKRAAFASDQLEYFSEAFERLKPALHEFS